MPVCLIGLGANLGDREKTLRTAVARLADHPLINVDALSRWYETSPVGGPAGQPAFLNGAVLIQTSLSAAELLDYIRWVEHELGRERRTRWAARTIDLDLLLYGDAVISSAPLIVPHPRMGVRRFVLEPAAEIAGSLQHPVWGWSMQRLLDHLDASVPYLALAARPSAGKTALANELARRLGGNVINCPGVINASNDRGGGSSDDTSTADAAWQREIDLLNARAARLAAATWTRSKELVISDYWFDQSLAYAAVNLSAERLSGFKDHWQALRKQVVQPRLTVMLPPAPRQSAGPKPKEIEEKMLALLADEFALLARTPDLGPILDLSDESPDRVLAEVLAALESMR